MLEAATLLVGKGIDAAVLHVHTVKPIDAETIATWAERTGAVVTLENHRIIGGLGSAVAEVLGENAPVPLHRMGFPDMFGESGSDDDLTEKYGFSPRHVATAAAEFLYHWKGKRR
jgi:transketolase